MTSAIGIEELGARKHCWSVWASRPKVFTWCVHLAGVIALSDAGCKPFVDLGPSRYVLAHSMTFFWCFCPLQCSSVAMLPQTWQRQFQRCSWYTYMLGSSSLAMQWGGSCLLSFRTSALNPDPAPYHWMRVMCLSVVQCSSVAVFLHGRQYHACCAGRHS